jgi:sec-independent protein translocase protein TatC
MVYMKASAIAAFFVSSPYVLWQFWGFVAPGSTRRSDAPGGLHRSRNDLLRRRRCRSVLRGASVTARWLLTLGSQFKAQLTLQSAFDFESRMLLGAGLVFEMPIVILVLSRFGIVTPGISDASLPDGRHGDRDRRGAHHAVGRRVDDGRLPRCR